MFYNEIEMLTTLKQMLQRLPTAFAQVNEGSTFENLLNEICLNYIFSVTIERSAYKTCKTT